MAKIQTKEFAFISGTVREPEEKALPSGATLVNLGIRTKNVKNANGDWESEWDNATCFGPCADVARNLSKGDVVFISGTVRERTYTAKDGTEKTAREITADFIIPMNLALGAGFTVPTQTPAASAAENTDKFVDVSSEEDLPF